MARTSLPFKKTTHNDVASYMIDMILELQRMAIDLQQAQAAEHLGQASAELEAVLVKGEQLGRRQSA